MAFSDDAARAASRRAVDNFIKRASGGKSPAMMLKRTMKLFVFYFIFSVVGLGTVFIVLLIFYYAVSFVDRKMHSLKGREKGIAIGKSYKHPHAVALSHNRGFSFLTFLGRDATCYLRLHRQQNPHTAIIGESGSGKTTFMEAFLGRTALEYEIPFLIIDWSGSYRDLGKETNLWDVPSSIKVNPMALRGMAPERRAGIASEVLQFALQLTPLQTQRLRDCIMDFYSQGIEPNIADLCTKLASQKPIVTKLRQASAVFGDENELFWSSFGKASCVVELQGLTVMEKNLVTQSLLQRVIEEFKEENKLKLYIALDDAYQAVGNFEGMESPVSRIVREGRKFGFGLAISTQLVQDLPDAVLGNTSLKFLHSYHEPHQLGMAHSMMDLSSIEGEILKRAPIGYGFLFDQHGISHGSGAQFVKVKGLSNKERAQLSAMSKLELGKVASLGMQEFDSAEGSEPYGASVTSQRASDPYDAMGMRPSSAVPVVRSAHKDKLMAPLTPTASQTMMSNKQKRDLETIEVLRGIDLPSVVIYRFLLCLMTSNSVRDALKEMRARGWATSLTTLYGNKSKEGLLARARRSGYVARRKLTERGLAVVDSERLIAKQGMNSGSEEHKALMRKTIELIQQRGNFAFVPNQQGSFDVGELEPASKSRWSQKVHAYEAQTNALPGELEKCSVRSARLTKGSLASLTIVSTNKEYMKATKEAGLQCLML